MQPGDKASDQSPPKEVLSPPQEGGQSPQVAGYKVEDLLTAPLAPPQPAKTESSQATRNHSVLFLTTLGIVLFLIGLMLMLLFSTLFGIIVALLGGVAVAIAVFAPFRA